MLPTRPPSLTSSSPARPDPFDLYLVEDRRRFQGVLNQGSKLVLVLDESGTLRYANPLARRAFHQFADQLPGCHFFSMVHRSDLCRLMRHLDRLVKAETAPLGDGSLPSTLLLRLFTRRDRWHWFKASALRFSYCAEDAEHILAVTLKPLPFA